MKKMLIFIVIISEGIKPLNGTVNDMLSNRRDAKVILAAVFYHSTLVYPLLSYGLSHLTLPKKLPPPPEKNVSSGRSLSLLKGVYFSPYTLFSFTAFFFGGGGHM